MAEFQLIGVGAFNAALEAKILGVTAATFAGAVEAGEAERVAIAASAGGRIGASVTVLPTARFQVWVGPSAVYARRRELGYRKRSGRGRNAMGPHPYFERGAQAGVPEVGARFLEAWRTAW